MILIQHTALPPLKKLYLHLQMNKEIFSPDAVFFKSVPNNIFKSFFTFIQTTDIKIKKPKAIYLV